MLRRLAVWNRGAFRARRSVQAEGRTERGHHHRRGAGRALSHVFFEARRDRGRFRRLWLCRSFSANRSFFLFSILIFGRGSRTRSSLFVISLSLCSLVSVSSTHRKKKTARDAPSLCLFFPSRPVLVHYPCVEQSLLLEERTGV